MSRYLDMVDAPEHVKKLKLDQLKPRRRYSQRTDRIPLKAWWTSRSQPGSRGADHCPALLFSTPKDKFVWDVSHQTCVHKLLTGRKNRFNTIRTTDGLNGFALRSERTTAMSMAMLERLSQPPWASLWQKSAQK